MNKSMRCPKCKMSLPHFQHPLCKVYICLCGGEIHTSLNPHHMKKCVRCNKVWTEKEVVQNNLNYIYKVLCPLQFDIKVEETL